MSTLPPTDYTHFTIQPLTLHIGAEVNGIDLSKPLHQDVLDELCAAFVTWKVLFFREQCLGHAEHVAFAKQMGTPTIGHAVFGHVEGFPEVYSIGKHRVANSTRNQKATRPWTGWHTDITAAVNPPSASILRGVDIPPYGGDTYWTNLAMAYHGLSEPFHRFLETLNGVHQFEVPQQLTGGTEYSKEIEDRYMESVHPLITVHPITGERLLFISPDFIDRIEGLSPQESELMLEFLWEHAVKPEYTVRYKWQPGDVAMWDNRSTAHRAPSDIFQTDFDRQLYRVTLVGEPLIGVDGRKSQAISGDPILSADEELRLSTIQ